MEYHCNVSDLPAMVREQQLLHAGDRVILSGTVYTSRDAAHKRLTAAMRTDGVQALPFPLKDAVLYYAGPTAAPPGRPIGACGPTTSGRMDPYAPMLLDSGLLAMIGKGERTQEVCDAIEPQGRLRRHILPSVKSLPMRISDANPSSGWS